MYKETPSVNIITTRFLGADWLACSVHQYMKFPLCAWTFSQHCTNDGLTSKTLNQHSGNTGSHLAWFSEIMNVLHISLSAPDLSRPNIMTCIELNNGRPR